MANNPAFESEQQLAEAMRGVDFPAGRDRLVEQARQNGAPDDVVERFAKLREGQFDNVAQVMDATND